MEEKKNRQRRTTPRVRDRAEHQPAIRAAASKRQAITSGNDMPLRRVRSFGITLGRQKFSVLEAFISVFFDLCRAAIR